MICMIKATWLMHGDIFYNGFEGSISAPEMGHVWLKLESVLLGYNTSY